MKKKRVWLWILLPLALCQTVLLMWGRSSQWGISQFVTLHQNDLEKIASDRLNGFQTAEQYRGIVVEGVFSGKHPIVQFSSGGFGLAPSTTYYGFYYSEDDVPVAFQNVDIELVPTGNDKWTWSDGTDNGGTTQRISECWFSYQAWF